MCGSMMRSFAERVLAPNAIRPIEDLVPLLYPGVKVSYGTIQQHRGAREPTLYRQYSTNCAVWYSRRSQWSHRFDRRSSRSPIESH